MHYQPHDRAPLCDSDYWDETQVVWHEQGLPRDVVNTGDRCFFDFFGLDFPIRRATNAVGVEVGLVPAFQERVLEDRGDHEVFQQADGVRVLRGKFMGSIPKPLARRLVDRESWREHYVPRLDPLYPDRYPTWFEEMVTTVADCIIGTLGRVLETGGQFNALAMWEDMCYNAGPLLSPKHFRQFLVPHYRRIADLMHRHGVDVVWVDCDGKIDDLIPLWLDAGVNCMFPVETGTWGADPLEYRRRSGPELLMMGGFDKRILSRTREQIEAEVHRLTPLVEEGGYIGFCDHLVPPDVPFENYMFYLETVREVWGKGIGLRPMGQLEGS